MDDYHSKKIRLVDGREFPSLHDFNVWLLHNRDTTEYVEIEPGLLRPETKEERKKREYENFLDDIEQAQYGWDDEDENEEKMD